MVRCGIVRSNPSQLTLGSRLTGGNILKIIFGYTIKEKDDRFVNNADIAMKNFSKSTSPGWLVDIIPACSSFHLKSFCISSYLAALRPASAPSPALDPRCGIPPSSCSVEERDGRHV